MFADLPLVLSHIQAGNLRALAVADPESTPALPGVVPVAQSVSGYEASAWYGLFAPAKTPEPVLQRLRSEVVDIVKLPEMRKAMLELGARPSGISGADLRKFQQAEIQRWREVVRDANIRMD